MVNLPFAKTTERITSLSSPLLLDPEVKLGVDDKLREVKNLRIPRADIARACVQALAPKL